MQDEKLIATLRSMGDSLDNQAADRIEALAGMVNDAYKLILHIRANDKDILWFSRKANECLRKYEATKGADHDT